MLLGAIYPYASIVSILLVYSLIRPFLQPCLVLVGKF